MLPNVNFSQDRSFPGVLASLFSLSPYHHVSTMVALASLFEALEPILQALVGIITDILIPWAQGVLTGLLHPKLGNMLSYVMDHPLSLVFDAFFLGRWFFFLVFCLHLAVVFYTTDITAPEDALYLRAVKRSLFF